MKATIVIPTYDEADALPELLERVLGLPERFQVLVVDDASPDGTGALADAVAAREPRVTVLHRPGKLGLGSAYRDGFARALREGADAVFEMDADHSHNPKYLPALLAPLRADADVTVGSRYVHGIRVENWPFRRLLLSRFANYYVSFACGLPGAVLTDATSGFRGYRREVLEAIGLERVRSNGYSFQVEMAFRAWRLGFRLCEVPICFEEHYLTSSKMSKAIVWEAIWRTPLLRLTAPRRKRRPAPAPVAEKG
ncbi:MAG TPA: polyprenol monophosphomannose synthase [Candidatus Polarisedimenticolaceae bacterium]|nr:polyprenol monophosphomannose synthase [Candidatus Polarisedimenticolaceae bacterium]